MCARRPTRAMPKPIYSLVWTSLLPFHGRDVISFIVLCTEDWKVISPTLPTSPNVAQVMKSSTAMSQSCLGYFGSRVKSSFWLYCHEKSYYLNFSAVTSRKSENYVYCGMLWARSPYKLPCALMVKPGMKAMLAKQSVNRNAVSQANPWIISNPWITF